MGFLLALIGGLFWLQEGLRPVLARLQGEQVITAYVLPKVQQSESEKLVDEIRTKLAAPEVNPEVVWVGVDEFLARLKTNYPDLARELEEMGSELPALVPRHVSISGVFAESALAQVRAIPGIESAESSKDRYKHIVGAFRALRWIARALVAGLCVALITGLIHLSKMNAFLHRDALVILKQWGAGLFRVQLPSLISGLGVGVLGGLVAALLWLLFADSVSHGVRAFSPVLRELPGPSTLWALAFIALGAAVGLLSGWLGHWMGETSA